MKQNPLKITDHIGIAVVFLCHDGCGRFVLAQRGANARNEAGAWDIGGGALEIGEDVEQTLRREIMEEYGAEVLDFDFFGYRDVHYDHAGAPMQHWLALDFCARVRPEQVRIAEPHKFDDLGWFTLDRMPNQLYSRLPEFLTLHADRIAAVLSHRVPIDA